MDVTSFRNRISTIVAGAGVALLSLASAGGAVADDASGDVENFRYSSWDVEYDISLDSQGRAQAEVTEELEAQFPDTDQNLGIVRALPLRYQGAPAAPEDITVTDSSGDEVPFEVEDGHGFRSILVGDDTFVHGAQTYVMSYTVDDVMHATEEADEFYWDLVPVDRHQDISEISARVALDAQLSSSLTGSSACYRGTPDDSASCAIETTGTDQTVFSVSETQLPAGQGLTMAIGVQPGTVTQPPERQDNFLLDVVPLLFVGAAFLLAGGGAWSVMAMVRRHRDNTSQTNIEYGIPDGMNPLIAKWVTGRGDNSVVATILDLAVRGVLQIEVHEEESGLSKKKTQSKPVLRLVAPQLATDPLELQLLEGLFPGLAPGATFDFPKNSKAFTKAAQLVLQESGKAVLERGYQMTLWHRGAVLSGWISLALLIPVVVLLVMGASRDNTATTVIGIAVGVLTLALIFICVLRHRVLTPMGAAQRTQVDRMRQMMKASEADRLNMMQSLTQATRKHVSSTGSTTNEMIELYEQLLPYAVLFAMQKDWAKVLASAYQHYQVPAPVWYPALLHHGTEGMQTSLNSMLSSVSSAATTSSSGAGSTGGGVAGGGVAGGGGGGGAAGGR